MPRKRFIVCAVSLCLSLVLILAIGAATANAQKSKPNDAPKPTMLVLGVSHLNNPGRDVLNIQWDDVLTAKRQKEIRDLVNSLKRFKPTKIAVEMPFGSAKLEERYRQYLRGEYQLTRDEIDQIGLRLAKELNQPEIYGIDADGNFDINRVIEFAKANNQQEKFDKALAMIKSQVDEANELVRSRSITDVFRFLNDQRQLESLVRLKATKALDRLAGKELLGPIKRDRQS